AKADDVGELLEADRLALHLAPDRVGTLAPAADLGRDAAIGKLLGELQLNVGYQTDAARLERVEPLADHLVGLRIELAERQILELLAHLMHAHAAGERGVDIEGLLGGAAAGLRGHMRERAQ